MRFSDADKRAQAQARAKREKERQEREAKEAEEKQQNDSKSVLLTVNDSRTNIDKDSQADNVDAASEHRSKPANRNKERESNLRELNNKYRLDPIEKLNKENESETRSVRKNKSPSRPDSGVSSIARSVRYPASILHHRDPVYGYHRKEKRPKVKRPYYLIATILSYYNETISVCTISSEVFTFTNSQCLHVSFLECTELQRFLPSLKTTSTDY